LSNFGVKINKYYILVWFDWLLVRFIDQAPEQKYNSSYLLFFIRVRHHFSRF